MNGTLENERGGMRRFGSIAAIIVCCLLILTFLILNSLQTRQPPVRFPSSLKAAFAKAPIDFLPAPLRDSAIDLGMEVEEIERIVTGARYGFRLPWRVGNKPSFDVPSLGARFNRLYVRGRYAIPDVPIGPHRTTGFYCFRDTVADGYEARLREALRDCLTTFGAPQRRLISQAPEAASKALGRNAHLFWDFDSIEIWLEHSHPGVEPVETKDERGNSVILMPSNSYILRILSRDEAERMRARSRTTYRTPNQEEAERDFTILNEIADAVEVSLEE